MLLELSAIASCLEKYRPSPLLHMPELLNAIDKDVAFNSNAIEGNPVTYRETAIILGAMSVGGGRTLRHTFLIYWGITTPFKQCLLCQRTRSRLHFAIRIGKISTKLCRKIDYYYNGILLYIRSLYLFFDAVENMCCCVVTVSCSVLADKFGKK
jgi:hypothetical protein